jgi:hypothetical protein
MPSTLSRALTTGLVIVVLAAIAIAGFTPPVARSSSPAWLATGSMNSVRGNHTATRLQDGRVLVAGGYYASATVDRSYYHSSAEIYDPVTRIWTLTGSMAAARASHTATLLPNGKVLVVGGDAELNAYSACHGRDL